MRTLAGLLLGLMALTARAEVEVSIDRNPVQANESFQLVFTLDSDPGVEPDFSVLQQHFLILGSNQTSSIKIINGQYQRSVKYSLRIKAKEAGDYMIPAIHFGQQRSKPLQVKVNPAADDNPLPDELVFEVTARQSEIFVQSQVIVKLRLLSASNISAYQFGDIEVRGVDAVIEPLGDMQDYQTRIADRNYLVLEQRFALFPQQSGQLLISSILAEVRLPSNSSFDPFRSGGEILRLSSKPVTIDVKPIPAEADGEYWLPARQVVLREEISEKLDDLVAGEPITRSLSIVADGLTAAQLPEIDIPVVSGIKQYPDKPGLQNRRSGNGITGIRTQKIALIPGSPGIYHLPEINLRWWNLHTGKLETASIPARELQVDGVTTGEPASQNTTDPVAGDVSSGTRHSGPGFWLWVSLLLALGWGLHIIYWRYRMRHRRELSGKKTNSLSLRQARKSLQRACAADDAAATRNALIGWGNALLAPQVITNLRQLEDLFGSEFSAELVRLNRSLYASGQDEWRGADLWQLCQTLESGYRGQFGPSVSELSPLNPR